MAAVTICSDLESPKINSLTVSIASQSICHDLSFVKDPGRYQSKQGPQPCLLRDGDTSRRSGWEGPNPSLIPEKDFQAQAVHQESSVLPSCPKSSWVLRECVSGVGRVMGWAARGVGRAGAPCPRPALIPCLNLTGCLFSRDLS